MVHPNSLSHRKKGRVFPVASKIRARSTRLAGSVRDREIAAKVATSSSLIANSIACRHPAMTSIPCFRIKQRGYKPCQQK
jgi:hypothetical protein